MRTTIVVEDGGAPASRPAPLDAGAAPTGEDGPSGAEVSARDGANGGMPPAWLVEAIAEAGGMSAPSSPEDIELAGLDAGQAPV
jgi:hypothetical protein